jgi:hypothetical protein
VLAAEARRQRVLLERIIDGRLRLEEVPHRQEKGLHEFGQEDGTGSLIQRHVSLEQL